MIKQWLKHGLLYTSTLNTVVFTKLITILLVTIIISQPLSAQEVVLNPVEIKGNVSFGGLEYSSYTIQAKSDAFSGIATQYFDPIIALADYSLTVNVEQNSTRKYRVRAAFSNGNDTYGSPAIYVDAVDTTPSQAVLLDLMQNDIATVHGTIILPSGVNLANSNVRFYFNEPGISLYDQIAGYKFISANELTFDFPVAANAEMYIYAYLFLDDGQSFVFQIDPFTVVKDGIKNVVFEIKLAEDVGAIGGNINIAGPVEITKYQTRLFGPAGNIYKNFIPQNFTTASQNNGVDWLVKNLPSSTTQPYQQWLWAYYRSQGYLVSMFIDSNAYSSSNRNYVLTDQTTQVDIQANQAFIEGQLTLEGNYLANDLSLILINASSLEPGGSKNYVDLNTLYYSALGLDVSKWNISSIDFTFKGANNSYREILTYNPHRLLTKQALSASQPFLQDLIVPMGSVTVKYRVTDGQTLSYPKITTQWPAKCSYFDQAGELLYFWRPNVRVYDQQDVLTGEVVFHGPDAYCNDIKAEATVGGSITTFGIIDVEVISGVDVVIDIGGPTLSVDVSPNTVFASESITVTGKATDDIGITSVTVNGYNAQISSSNNPNDGNEVLFSVLVPLTLGENTLFTIARDNSNKTGSDSRKVYRDSAAPTLDFTPNDGDSFTAPITNVTINGTVSDDNDISLLTINGNKVELTKLSPGSYNFSYTLPLNNCNSTYPCVTNIVAIATDVADKQTQISHQISQISAGLACDIDNNSYVDRSDIGLILRARNTKPTGADDKRDHDKDGLITVKDARQCLLLCTLPRCATP